MFRPVLAALAVIGCGARSTVPLDGDRGGVDPAPQLVECNGAPRRLDVDPLHCGACGHDCLGGACSAGRCAPVSLATSTCASALALDETSVWWTDPCDGAVFRAPKDGGTRRTFAGREPLATAITLDRGRAFWTLEGRPGTVRVANVVDPVPLDLAVGDDSMPWLVLDDTHAYWASAGGAGAIRGVARSGGPVTTLADHQGFPAGLARSGDVLLWPDVGGTISRISTAGGSAPAVLVAEESHPSSIVADDVAVYWTDADDSHVCSDGSVRRADPHAASPRPTTLAVHQRCAATIALDETSVYWSTHDGGMTPCAHGALLRVDKAGGTPARLAEGPFCVRAIAADARAIYFIESHTRGKTSSVMRLAK